jgi:hypothetical protein
LTTWKTENLPSGSGCQPRDPEMWLIRFKALHLVGGYGCVSLAGF